jgi:protein MAK16
LLATTALTAVTQVNEHLAYWPKFLVHKNKQRLTKITQYLIRMRKLEAKPRLKMVPLATRCCHFQRPSRAESALQRTLQHMHEISVACCVYTHSTSYIIGGPVVLCRKEQQTRRKLEKAETAAKLETTIENELLDRLQKGTYGDIYNFPTREYLKVWVVGGFCVWRATGHQASLVPCYRAVLQ